jgi:hypothetical protein
MTLLSRFLFTISLLLAAPLGAQTLWPGTMSGQSVDEVKRLFPEAREPENPTGLSRGRGIELLQIPRTVIGDREFTVHFFFKDGALVQVTLNATGEITFKDFEKFRDLLRHKYDMERSTVNAEYLLVTWKIAQTTIELTWTPKRREIATLAITYEAPIAKPTDRL